jgi:hypothetical protein
MNFKEMERYIKIQNILTAITLGIMTEEQGRREIDKIRGLEDEKEGQEIQE